MKFFKHFTDSHRGKSMQMLVKRFGMAGVGRYWVFVELCSEKLSKAKDEEYTEEHCRFDFEKGYLARSLGFANLKQCSSYLEAVTELGLCSAIDTGDVYACSMPKLLECMDRDAKRARTERDPAAPKRKKKREIKKEEKELLAAADLIEILSDDIRKLYDDETYVTRESVKAWAWLKDNPRKSPKDHKGYRRFFSGWLERGWEQYRRSIPSNKPTATHSWEQTAQRVLDAINKAGTGTTANDERIKLIGQELNQLACRVGIQRIRELKRDSFTLKTLAGWLEGAAQAHGGAA